MAGFTDNYIKVELPYDPLLINDMKAVELLAINDGGSVEVAWPDAVLTED